MTKDDYFVPENAKPDKKEFFSPSKKYKLVLSYYSTKPGAWSYTRGEVYDGDKLVADIKRNYCSFPFSWIEDHPNGHEYLVAGEDYQGQTIVELDSGRRKDYLPEDAEMGFGFCWVNHQFDKSNQILIVGGCIWACPYEFRFYDFSDPMAKLTELTTEEYVECGDRWPEIDADGTIRCFDVSENDDGTQVQNAIVLFKREGDTLVKTSEWVSDEEQKRRADAEEANRKYESWLKEFKETDPLFLEMLNQVKDPVFDSESGFSIGVTYEKWCPGFDGMEKRICKRIHRGSDTPTIDLEWADKTGPILLKIHLNEKTTDKFVFPHSADGMLEAFQKAKGAIFEYSR